MHRGWTKSWRKELDSDIWQMPPYYLRTWHWLLHKANWELKLMPTMKAMKMAVSPGMVITSYEHIRKGIGYKEGRKLYMPSKRTVMRILKWLEGNGMISLWGNEQGTIILINNWHTYQGQESVGETAGNDDGETLGETQRETQRKRRGNTTKEVKAFQESLEASEGRREKGVRPNGSHPRPLSFQTYKGKFPLREDVERSIGYFLAKREAIRGEEHPPLRKEQWQEIVDGWFYVYDGDLNRTVDVDLSEEDMQVLIDRYFDTEFQEGCDYRLPHFCSGEVKALRFYEELY